ncbi:hypothetical protein [Erythrobacter tepidarius]|uniref:hypothetical protein n=1 Tax=Erythrobacter tepidarius TaxID=60454 RepID=UPI001180460A|nr:hypothetical protein [Erythrobacter tepidarius]
MVLLVDPAALGGFAGLLAVASWAIGRVHGPLAGEKWRDHGDTPAAAQAEPDCASGDAPPPLDDRLAADRAAPCQQQALEERCAALALPFTLAELHAEASAIRRAARILGDVPEADALIVLDRPARSARCRFIGLSGIPTCPATTRLACSHGDGCAARAGQNMPGARHVMRDPV